MSVCSYVYFCHSRTNRLYSSDCIELILVSLLISTRPEVCSEAHSLIEGHIIVSEVGTLVHITSSIELCKVVGFVMVENSALYDSEIGSLHCGVG